MLSYFDKHLFKPIRLTEKPADDLSLIIVIPCHNEPDILSTLNSLSECKPCKGNIEVIIVINAASDDAAEVMAQNEKSYQEIILWLKMRDNPRFNLYILRDEDLPHKHAGVGLARKIGMDEAAWRFESIGKKDGIIVCLDADCVVADDYLTAIESCFTDQPTAKAASIYFEHPLDILDASLRKGIISYELHLRCYIQALRYAGYPYAFHTIGSSLCVKGNIYQRAGGMNRRKAGEDFYFLHKIIPLGGFCEINNTAVYPSPRISERVPFGTGRAMKDWMASSDNAMTTYDVKIFDELKIFIQAIPLLYRANHAAVEKIITGLPGAVQSYLSESGFAEKLDEINHHTANAATFMQRFYHWMEGFRTLKIIHYMRDNFYPNIPIGKAAFELLQRMNRECKGGDEREMLLRFRELDKRG